MDFGGLSVGVSRGDAFAEGLQAAHPCLDAAPGSRAILFPRAAVFADRDDRDGLPLDDGGVAPARVVGAVGGYRADLLVRRDLAEQVGEHGAVAVPAGGEFHGADVGCGWVHGQMHLAPLATALRAMLARLPFAVAEELDPGAVDQQVQRAICAAIGNLDGQGLLPPAEGGKVRHGPVQASQPEQAGHHPGGLAQRELEENLDRQAELNGRIGKHRWPSRPRVTRREPGHLLVDPDQQRPPLPQRRVVAGPVRRAIAGGRWLAHAACLTAWIREVNPPQTEFCNNAAERSMYKPS